MAETTKYRTCFDVYHNDINIEVTPSKKFISGKVKISAKAVINFDTLQIDLYKNMKIKSVDFENQSLIYKREEGAVFIKMPREIKAEEKFSITITMVILSQQSVHLGMEVLFGKKIKMEIHGLVLPAKVKGQVYGGQVRI